MAVRALVAEGNTQAAVAKDLGVTQPAVSQLLQPSDRVSDIEPTVVREAAAPVVKEIVAQRGFTDLAAFGSVALGNLRADCEIDPIVRAPTVTR